MSETVTVGLTDSQRDLLIRGLRYVRSSVMLEVREPTTQDDEERRMQLRDIAQLVDRLNVSEPGKPR